VPITDKTDNEILAIALPMIDIASAAGQYIHE